MSSTNDLWPAPKASASFVDRVMADVARECARTRARRAMGIAVFACAAVLAVGWGISERARRAATGDVVAGDRMEIEIAPGVRAVLEQYAHVAWTATGVTQDRGDVFYRLAPGAELLVRTPVGEIASAGACSRVRVDPAPTPADSPVVFVSVSQGAVAFRKPGGSTSLSAGHYARVDRRSVRTDDDDASGEIAFAFAHERAKRFAREEPPDEVAPEATTPVRVAAPRPSARPRPSVAVTAPIPTASATATTPPRVFLSPPCVCNPTLPVCDCVVP